MVMIEELAGIKIDNLKMEEALARLESFIAKKTPHLIVTPNPEMIVASQEDHELRDILNNADLRLCDGISMVVVSQILGRPLKERVSGIDFLLEAIKLSAKKGYKVFLLGGVPGVAEVAAHKLSEQSPGVNIVGVQDGYFKDNQDIITRIKQEKPDMLFAGMGAGKQEKWLARHKDELGIPVIMGVGGSFDVIAGIKKRAPSIYRRLYIEWLYRLITEPWRIKRQLALPKFLWLTLIWYNQKPDEKNR